MKLTVNKILCVLTFSVFMINTYFYLHGKKIFHFINSQTTLCKKYNYFGFVITFIYSNELIYTLIKSEVGFAESVSCQGYA